MARCSQLRFRGGTTSDADVTQVRERFIAKASRELTLDEAQKAKLGGLADALKAQHAALMAGGVYPRSEMILRTGVQVDRARALIDGKTNALWRQVANCGGGDDRFS